MDAGLEKVIAAETVLSEVDGKNGHLVIRGYTVEDLAQTETFEGVIHLLWSGFFENLPAVKDLRARLGEARVTAFEKLAPHFGALNHDTEMENLRTALSFTQDGHSLNTAISALAAAAVCTAARARMAVQRAPLAPDARKSHAEDLLAMASGTRPTPEQSRALDAYLVTVAEHGLNASTFAARIAASTRAGLISSVIAGMSALKGPLHGGAPGPILDMLDAIGSIDHAEAWISEALERGERLMGFGHRVYQVRDPRADALKRAMRRLPRSAGRLSLAEGIETGILKKLAKEKPDRKLDTNVEYYTAVLLEALGVRRQSFTCVFACARIAGWIAHAQEQISSHRIVRPSALYIGPAAQRAADRSNH